MSGIIDQKQLPVYLVIVFATLGSYVVNSSDDVITLDAIDSIKKDISDLEIEVKRINFIIDTHEKIPAHPAHEKRTDYLQLQINEIKQRLFRLEGAQ